MGPLRPWPPVPAFRTCEPGHMRRCTEGHVVATCHKVTWISGQTPPALNFFSKDQIYKKQSKACEKSSMAGLDSGHPGSPNERLPKRPVK